MPRKKVIIELKHNEDLYEAAMSAVPPAGKKLDIDSVPRIAGVDYDISFAPTHLPRMTASAEQTSTDISKRIRFKSTDTPRPNLRLMSYAASFDCSPSFEEEASIEKDIPIQKEATYVVRAEIDDSRIDELSGHKDVAGVFADVRIQPMITCFGDPAKGMDKDVEQLLCVPQMHDIQMDGAGVMVAIVDTGINLAHLESKGKRLTIDAARSWVPSAGRVAGGALVHHGTMCAFDAAIAAPKATFLDIQLLTGQNNLAALLSDAIRAYIHLYNIMMTREFQSMVVSNSWGMYHPSWDFPVGHPANYSDNVNHPFNRMVATLERAGADILFASCNCGTECPNPRCKGVCKNAIYGANSHPSVLTIAGVDISKNRVGYSTQGPGRLSQNKPDICGYTHFAGSQVFGVDSGTSAATPVVAGVVAAVRSKMPFDPKKPGTSPSALRDIMRTTAEDKGGGFNYDYGYGIVGGCSLYNKFK